MTLISACLPPHVLVFEKGKVRGIQLVLDSFRHRLSQKISVAAHLRGLRAEDPSKKGHPRPLEQKLKLFRH